MNPEPFEKAVIVSLYHNKVIRDTYMESLLPNIFTNVNNKIIAYLMKLNYPKQMNEESLFILQEDKRFIRIQKKRFLPKLSLETISEIVNQPEGDVVELFEEAYHYLHNYAYIREVKEIMKDIKYESEYDNPFQMKIRANKIIKLYDIIFSHKYKKNTNGIKKAAKLINGKDNYIRFSSDKLTAFLGGWSRGYTATVIGKPSHGKSTFISSEAAWLIKNNIVDKVHIISPEENELVFWRRIFSYELNIPLQKLIRREVILSEEDINKVYNIYQDRLIFHEKVIYKDVINLLFSLNDELVIIDYINAISYPQNNQYTGIQMLINKEKEWLKANPNSAIINLTQPNTKSMKLKNKLVPDKDDAYMSSILEHASREYLAIYYPYKDSLNPTNKREFKRKINKKDYVEIYIQKNSFGEIGMLPMKYISEFGKYVDFKEESSKNNTVSLDPVFGNIFN